MVPYQQIKKNEKMKCHAGVLQTYIRESKANKK